MMWKAILFILLLFLAACGGTQEIQYPGNLRFFPIEAHHELRAPGRGVEQWHDQNTFPQSYANDSATYSPDKYYRFSWSQLEKGPGEYDWTIFDQEIQDAIRNRQSFSFGIMPTCPSCTDDGKSIPLEGKIASYPAYLHEQMQAEAVKDWVSPISEMWVPNWNSPAYLAALDRLNLAIAEHLNNQSFQGIRYRDVVRYIDLRGYGSFGEWHEASIVNTMSDHPEGTRASTATLRRIVNSHLQAFQPYRLVALLGSLDGGLLRNTMVPPEIGYMILRAKTEKGLLGIRRDNWGSTDDYIRQYMERHPVVHQGLSFADAIRERWKTAPIVGEPIHDAAYRNGCSMGDLENQVRTYHASSFGNGNFALPGDPCLATQVRAATLAAGFRIAPVAGTVDSAIVAGNNLTIKLFWQNRGVAPAYDPWQLHYQLHELRSDSLFLEMPSPFNPAALLPSDTAIQHTDQLTLPASLPAGNYNLKISLRDPKGYFPPLPLAIQGRQSDGSYTLRTVEVSQPR